MQPKAQTLQQRFGFQDHELSTPKHDEIMLWLDANAERLFPHGAGELYSAGEIAATRKSALEDAVAKYKDYRSIPSVLKMALTVPVPVSETDIAAIGAGIKWKHVPWGPEMTQIPYQIADRRKIGIPDEGVPPKFSSVLPEDPPCRINHLVKVWERPVMSGAYTIGFIDMEISIVRFNLSWESGDSAVCDPERGAPFRWTQRKQHLPYEPLPSKHMIEVKPEIRSLGEVIRQIRMYESHCPDAKFYICCPDPRFKPALESQGIGFIQSP